MSDLIYLAVIVGFFVAAFGLLRACERIIGPDAPAAPAPTNPAVAVADAAEPESVTA